MFTCIFNIIRENNGQNQDQFIIFHTEYFFIKLNIFKKNTFFMK